MTRPKLVYLGDLLGPLRYFGNCAKCKRQFMSTHDRVAVIDGQHVCERCVPRDEAPAVKNNSLSDTSQGDFIGYHDE